MRYLLDTNLLRDALRGALASVAAAESSPNLSLPSRYAFFAQLIRGISTLPLHLYSDEADALYQSWPKSLHAPQLAYNENAPGR